MFKGVGNFDEVESVEKDVEKCRHFILQQDNTCTTGNVENIKEVPERDFLLFNGPLVIVDDILFVV